MSNASEVIFRTKAMRLSKMSFIRGFQQVLVELLLEERRLLGSKPTRASLSQTQSIYVGSKTGRSLAVSGIFCLNYRNHGTDVDEIISAKPQDLGSLPLIENKRNLFTQL